MSILASVVSFIRSKSSSLKLNFLEQNVLIRYAAITDENPHKFPTQKELAQEMNISERHLRNTLNSLIVKKLLTSERNGKGKDYRLKDEHRNYSSAVQQKTGTTVPMMDANSGTTVPVNTFDTGTGVPVSTELSTGEIEATPINNIYNINNNNINNNKKGIVKGKKAEEPIEYPDWLNVEQFGEYVDYRKSIKAPMSLLAQKKAINMLAKLREEGQDISAVIDQSIINGWKGLFPINRRYYSQAARPKTIWEEKQERRMRADDFLKNMETLPPAEGEPEDFVGYMLYLDDKFKNGNRVAR